MARANPGASSSSSPCPVCFTRIVFPPRRSSREVFHDVWPRASELPGSDGGRPLASPAATAPPHSAPVCGRLSDAGSARTERWCRATRPERRRGPVSARRTCLATLRA
jgi:hypothetical protein